MSDKSASGRSSRSKPRVKTRVEVPAPAPVTPVESAAVPTPAAVPAPTVEAKAPVTALRAPRSPWLGWAAAAAAVLLLVVAAGWALTAQSRADSESHRSQVFAQAITIMGSPRSESAVLHGSAQADGARGFVAIDASGAGYLVLVGLPAAPAGQAYQAWYITGDQPTSAGLLSVDDAGFAVLSLPAHDQIDQVTLTVEPAAGSSQPTSSPILSGEFNRRG